VKEQTAPKQNAQKQSRQRALDLNIGTRIARPKLAWGPQVAALPHVLRPASSLGNTLVRTPRICRCTSLICVGLVSLRWRQRIGLASSLKGCRAFCARLLNLSGLAIFLRRTALDSCVLGVFYAGYRTTQSAQQLSFSKVNVPQELQKMTPSDDVCHFFDKLLHAPLPGQGTLVILSSRAISSTG
jgi:hypothetical protein